MTVKELTDTLGGRLPNLGETLPSTDAILRAVGLQRQRAVFEAPLALLGALTVGLAMGAAIALLTTPKKGSVVRRELGDRINDATKRVTKRFGSPTPRSARGAA